MLTSSSRSRSGPAAETARIEARSLGGDAGVGARSRTIVRTGGTGAWPDTGGASGRDRVGRGPAALAERGMRRLCCLLVAVHLCAQRVEQHLLGTHSRTFSISNIIFIGLLR